MISPFPGRHAAWHVTEGFLEVHDTGKHAGETADDVSKEAIRWIKEKGSEKENWFLYLNFWDPHTPYRTPADYGNPFKDDPAPEWLTEEMIAKHRDSYGPMGARDIPQVKQWPGLPDEIASREDFKKWIDGYDTATYHDGLKDFPELMLFDIENDPNETTNLADGRPDIIGKGLQLLDAWVAEQMKSSDYPTDPMWNVIHEGGPFHTRGDYALDGYLNKLRKEDRHAAAERLERRHRPEKFNS